MPDGTLTIPYQAKQFVVRLLKFHDERIFSLVCTFV